MKQNSETNWLHELLGGLLTLSSEKQKSELIEKFKQEHKSADDSLVLQDIDELAALIVKLKSESTAPDHKIAALSELERAQLTETERIIDENLFDYYFQPIVNTVDGEIYSYEALMRPKSTMKLTPLHILKYAGLVNRLSDIECGTFLNVLQIVDLRKQEFSGKLVFINSIPEAKVAAEDYRSISHLLLKHADTAVVEMTEQSEVDDENLERLKERYRNMGIKMAIDDYGTGYSNIGNLLRYMPDFVKIDRSLLSEIQSSPKKRHFVREIIQFCHDNDILALAEGVETAEELRTVILLGADLIQGYYTARPAPEIVQSIPDDIKQQIKHLHQELEDGIGQKIYAADCSERVDLDRLVQSDIKRIVIGANGDGDVIIEGDSNTDSLIRLETKTGFKGKITLDNCWLSSVKNKPCIDIAENCDVTLNLIGDNKLEKGGIRVPQSSKLTIIGNGTLEIDVKSKEYYGIGNGTGLLHGELIFEQSGRITVNGKGETGIGIGSGNGGTIKIGAGQYRLNLQGDVGVGIGSLYADNELVIHDCDIGMELTQARGCAIGSIGKDNDITIYKASVKVFVSGIELSGIGSLDGEKLKFNIYEASCFVTVNGETCSGIAALEGKTDVSVRQAAVRLTVNGKQVLGIGGFSDDTYVQADIADIHAEVDSSIDVNRYARFENYTINSGSTVVEFNGKEVFSVSK